MQSKALEREYQEDVDDKQSMPITTSVSKRDFLNTVTSREDLTHDNNSITAALNDHFRHKLSIDERIQAQQEAKLTV